MKFKPNKKTIIIVSLLSVGIFALLFFSGIFSVLNNTFSTQSDCQAYVTDKCASGYSCSACNKVYSLPYNFDKSSGYNYVYPNGVYHSECVIGTSGTPILSTHTACANAVTSHNGWWCSENNLYYYDSNGVREELKENCQYGCSSIYTGGKTRVACNVANAPVPCYSCSSVVQSSASGVCPSGFSTTKPTNCGTTPPPATKNCYKCDTNTYTILTQSVTSCSSGYSETKPDCIKPDLCAGVTCPDNCDGSNFNSQGSCNPNTGKCVYANAQFGSANCIPTAQLTCYNCEGSKDFTVSVGQNCEGIEGGWYSAKPICAINCNTNQELVAGKCVDKPKSWFSKMIDWIAGLFKF